MELTFTAEDLAVELRKFASHPGHVKPGMIMESDLLMSLAGDFRDRHESWAWLKDALHMAGSMDAKTECAVIVCFGQGGTVQDRYTECVERHNKTDRTIRRWIDTGIPALAEYLIEASNFSGGGTHEWVNIAWLKDGDKTVISFMWFMHQGIMRDKPTLQVDVSWAGKHERRVLDGPLDWEESGEFNKAGYILYMDEPSATGWPSLHFYFVSPSMPAVNILNIPRFGDVQYTPFFIKGAVILKPTTDDDMSQMVSRTISDNVIETDLPRGAGQSQV